VKTYNQSLGNPYFLTLIESLAVDYAWDIKLKTGAPIWREINSKWVLSTYKSKA